LRHWQLVNSGSSCDRDTPDLGNGLASVDMVAVVAPGCNDRCMDEHSRDVDSITLRVALSQEGIPDYISDVYEYWIRLHGISFGEDYLAFVSVINTCASTSEFTMCNHVGFGNWSIRWLYRQTVRRGFSRNGGSFAVAYSHQCTGSAIDQQVVETIPESYGCFIG